MVSCAKALDSKLIVDPLEPRGACVFTAAPSRSSDRLHYLESTRRPETCTKIEAAQIGQIDVANPGLKRGGVNGASKLRVRDYILEPVQKDPQ